MERDKRDFDAQDSGVPVTTPDRNPDPLGPQHSAPAPLEGGGEHGEAGSPADSVLEQRRGRLDEDTPGSGEAGGPGVPSRGSGISESDPAGGL